MTTAQVLELRQQLGYVSPVTPLEPGDPPWCVSERPGFLEYMVHPDDAFTFLVHGFPVAGEPKKAAAVGVWPLINAIQLQISDAPHAPGWRNLPGNPRPL